MLILSLLIIAPEQEIEAKRLWATLIYGGMYDYYLYETLLITALCLCNLEKINLI